jgi:chemotaxis protein CheX
MTATTTEPTSGIDFAPTEEELATFVHDVWTSFIGDTPEPLPGPAQAAAVCGPDMVAAAVSITGSWQGHVVVQVSAAAASALAAAFLGLEDAAEAEPADVEDALGELVNMVGGNVKSLVPASSALSLPLVIRGVSSAPDTKTVCSTAVLWRDEPIVVTVLAAVTGTDEAKDEGRNR